MNAVTQWKRIHADYTAILWNAVAFGILGDVTSWREVDEETNVAEEGPGGPPPNVSWSENLIFGNMWVASTQKWLEHHSQELTQAAFQEVGDIENGLSTQRAATYGRWHRSEDGVLSSFEYLRRQIFGGWPLDKGLLRGLLRHVWRPGYDNAAAISVGDFGAGGGRYSEWLNDTGLVEAFAFDAVQSVGDISGGRVNEVDLAKPFTLWRTFKWAFCLEVGQQMSPKSLQTLLQNLRRHAEIGLVISLASLRSLGVQDSSDAAISKDDAVFDKAELTAFVERETGFRFDKAATAAVRQACELGELGKTVAVFRASD